MATTLGAEANIRNIVHSGAVDLQRVICHTARGVYAMVPLGHASLLLELLAFRSGCSMPLSCGIAGAGLACSS